MDMEPLSTFPAVAGEICHWSRLNTDLTELILSLLPAGSIVRASAVCKFWRFIVTHHSFASRVAAAARAPWLFLYGQNNVHLRRNQAFAFDPVSGDWIHLPPVYLSNEEDGQKQADECFVGSGGFIFATSASSRTSFCYAPLLCSGASAAKIWRETPPLRFSRRNPIIGVLRGEGNRGGIKLIVAGGVRFVGGLVDIEEKLAVEIFDSAAGGWQLCPPLPPEFRSGNHNSSQGLSSALIGDNSFYVSGIYSCLLARFDLSLHSWSRVRILRPPGVIFSFLVACRDQLLMAGLRSFAGGGPPSFVLWRVDDDGAACTEIGAMPQAMLLGMFEGEEEERFASLRCVGAGGVVYVFNEAHHRAYPACICEIAAPIAGNCKWRELPPLPAQVNRFHRIISFCSAVPLDSILTSDA